MDRRDIAELPLPDSVEGFKEFKDLWDDETGKLKESFLPHEYTVRPEDFKHNFTLGIISTPWSRSKTQWDIKFHFKKCKGLTVMRKLSTVLRDWVNKYEPGARFPEMVCRIDVSASPVYSDQLDMIMTGVPGEQVELCLETLLRKLKEVFG